MLPSYLHLQIRTQLPTEEMVALMTVLVRQLAANTATEANAETSTIHWRSGELSRPVTWRVAADSR